MDAAGLLAHRVAEAADAWLRDPLDAGVYRRLVDATLAWRAATGGGGAPDDAGTVPALVDDVLGSADGDAADDGQGSLAAEAPSDVAADEVPLLPERAPRRLDGTLAELAARLRSGVVPAPAADVPAPAPDVPGTDGQEPAVRQD